MIEKPYDFNAFVEECAGTVSIPNKPNTITDKQLLNIIFNTSGINIVLGELEKQVKELGQHRQRAFNTFLLTIKYHLIDIIKTINVYNFSEMGQEERNEYIKDKSENIVKEARKVALPIKMNFGRNNPIELDVSKL